MPFRYVCSYCIGALLISTARYHSHLSIVVHLLIKKMAS